MVLSGGRLGAELLGAEAAVAAGAALVLVLPYPDPASVWPAAEQARFAAVADAAQEVITLQQKDPADTRAARGALARRDGWFARNGHEAVVVWDRQDADVGRVVRSMQDAFGELDVWVLEV